MSKKLASSSVQRILTQNMGEAADDQSSQHIFTENSIQGDEENDSEILEPLSI